MADYEPYLGLYPYERKHSPLFHGRSSEVANLEALLVSHPLVLMHAQSGIGKTSLINAGLIPLLESEEMEVFPPARVRGAIPEGLPPEKIRNLYILNAIIGWVEGESSQPAALAGTTLADFLRTRPHRQEKTGLPALRVLIFDQFEELVTLYPERWREREDFFRQVAEALEQDPLLRVLIVVREDFVASLEPYASILPDILLTRFRLEALKEKSAVEAVCGPLLGSGRSFAPGVAEELVQNLLKNRVETASGDIEVVSGEFVEPVQLQVVCRMLWDGLASEVAEITHDHLKSFGDVDLALKRFYEDRVHETAAASGVSETELREWFETKLITQRGTRGSVWEGEGLPPEAVKRLEDYHIIRGEWRIRSRWYELIHDRFIEPVRNSNAAWFAERAEKIEAGKRLEAGTRGWISQGSGRAGLLGEVELLKAESWLASLSAEDKACPKEVRAFIETSRAEITAEKLREEEERKAELEKAQRMAAQEARADEAQRSRRHARIFGAIVAVLLVVAVFAAVKASQYAADVDRQIMANELGRAAFMTNMTRDPDLSLLLALQSMTTTYTKDHREVTDSALYSMARMLRSLPVMASPLLPADGIVAGAYSPDGRFLATLARDRKVRIWDLENGRESRRQVVLPEPASALALSHDAKVLATAGPDDSGRRWEVKVWDLQTGQLQRTVPHGRFIYQLAFSPDGRKLAAASADKTASIVPLTGEPVKILHPSGVSSVAFSPSGDRVATGSIDGSVRVFDTSGRPLGYPLKYGPSPILALAFSPDHKLLAAGSGDMERVAQLWDLATWKKLQTLTGHTSAINSIAFSGDGKLATASDDGTVKVWDAESGRELPASINVKSKICALGFDASRNRLLATSADSTARSFPLQDQNGAVSGRIYDLAYSPNGKYIATANSGGTATLWDSRSKQPIRIFPGHVDYVFGVAFSPDGKTLATASWDRTVKLWQVETGEELPPALKGHRDPIYRVAFSPDGRTLATASADGSVGIWDLRRRVRLASLLNPAGWVTSLAYSPDGRMLAAVGEGGMAKIWDTVTMKEFRTLKGHGKGMLQSVCFSNDGRFIAVAGSDNVVRICDRFTGACRVSIEGHTAPVWGLAFSPDSSMIATASWDKSARLWDAATGKQKMMLTEHNDRAYAVAFPPQYRDPSGRVHPSEYLATGGRDGNLIVDIIDPEQLMQAARGRINRSFTEAECRKFLTPRGDVAAMRAGLAKLCRRIGLERLARSLELAPYRESVQALAYVAAGNHLARYGDIDSAVAAFAKASRLDPSVQFSNGPEAKARELAAEPTMEQAYRFAVAGRQQQAIDSLRKAKLVDPNLGIDPVTFVRRVAIGRLTGRSSTRYAAREDWAKGLKELVRQDRYLSSTLERIKALQLMIDGQEMARAGNEAEALAYFAKAKDRDTTLANDARRESNRVRADMRVGRAQELLEERQERGLVEAMALFRQAVQLDEDAIPAKSWNALCWAGTVGGHHADAIIRRACDNAVSYGYHNPNYQDSRGLNRALNGEAKGAVEDLTAYAALLSRQLQGELDENQRTAMESDKRKRELWIGRLRAGQPVFADKRELEEFR